jgi:hypothetical protein
MLPLMLPLMLLLLLALVLQDALVLEPLPSASPLPPLPSLLRRFALRSIGAIRPRSSSSWSFRPRRQKAKSMLWCVT